MKKTPHLYVLIGLTIVMLLAGCSRSDAPVLGVNTDTTVPSETAMIPGWAQPTQDNGQLFQGLNLDGVGESDDEAYVSIYRWDETFDAATVISIHLGTGETLAKVYPIYGLYAFETGTLFSENKDAIVLELMDPRTNWGAASIIVLDVYAANNNDSTPYVLERLNTMNCSVNNGSNEQIIDREKITVGTRIIDIKGQPLMGLEVHFLGPDAKEIDHCRTIYWSGNNWA